MAKAYRFRSSKYLLCEPYSELERQTIYCSSPEELNDPMEGFRDIVWCGDSIVWANLLKHYVFCLHQAYLLFKVIGQDERLGSEHIPILGRWDDLPTPQLYELFDETWKKSQDELGLSGFCDRMESEKRKVRRDELLLYLRYIHLEVFSRIQRVWVENGLAPEEEFTQLASILREPKPTANELLELATLAEANIESFSELMSFTSRQVSEGQRLSHEYHLRDALSETLKGNQQFLLIDFPRLYVERLDKLLYPEWYAACFSKSFHNSSMWSHYGDGHKGVCLIFDTSDTTDGSSLDIYRPPRNRVNSGGPSIEEREHSLMPLSDISYSARPVTIDFFRNIGVLPLPSLMSLWYTDEGGTVSGCADHFTTKNGEDSWRKRHWEDFLSDITSKSKDWEYEQESRLILHGLLDLALDKRRRTLSYRFESLTGIIFGIRTSDEDKVRTMDIIQRKCLESERTDFGFFQAYYSPKHEDIRRFKLQVF